jgi:uncharacterized protein
MWPTNCRRCQSERVDAHLITVKQLDYGLSLPQLGQDLLERWQVCRGEQQRSAAVSDRHPDQQRRGGGLFQRSPASSAAIFAAQHGPNHHGAPIRDGARFRQASLEGIQRISTVLQGGEDPGEPVIAQVVDPTSNVPSQG